MGDFSNVESVIQNGLRDTAPTIALTVIYKGEVIIERAYGYLDPETRLQPTLNDTLFDLASVTKLYTTTTFLMQVAEGKIALDAPVVTVIPEFGISGVRPIEGGQNPHTLERENADVDTAQNVDPTTITFRHLLTHTSGLAHWRDLFLNVGPTPPPPPQADSVSRTERIATALSLIGGYPFVDVPNRTVRYSDLGLILLGEAVARLDSDPSPDVTIRRRVLDIGGFNHTRFNPADTERCASTEFDARWRERRCQGEVHDENACSLGGIAGHAGLFSIAGEVAAFGQHWLEAVKGRAANWLPSELAQESVREQTSDGYRGLGWVLKSPEYSSAGTHFSTNSFGHTGFTGTSLWIDPKRELVAAVLTNRVYLGRDASEIMTFRPAVHEAICEWVDEL